MDARETKIFESLRSLTESQATTISVLQDFKNLQPVEKANENKCECAEDSLSIDEPNVVWSAHSTPLYDGLSLVTLLIKAEAFQDRPSRVIGEEAQEDLRRQGIQHVEFYDEEAKIYTVLFYQPWYNPQTKEPTTIPYPMLFTVSSREGGFLSGTVGRWSFRDKKCYWENIGSNCSALGSCQDQASYYNNRWWTICGSRVYCVRC